MLDEFKLGEGFYFFFQTVKNTSSDGVNWMQFLSTTMAIFFGSALTFTTSWIEKTTRA